MLVEVALKCSESTVGGGMCITEANIKWGGWGGKIGSGEWDCSGEHASDIGPNDGPISGLVPKTQLPKR